MNAEVEIVKNESNLNILKDILKPSNSEIENWSTNQLNNYVGLLSCGLLK